MRATSAMIAVKWSTSAAVLYTAGETRGPESSGRTLVAVNTRTSCPTAMTKLRAYALRARPETNRVHLS